MPTLVLKTRLAQIEVAPGQPVQNACKMVRAIKEAVKDEVELIIFPEMAIPGYLIGDLWEQPAFLHQCQDCGNEIRLAADNIIVVFGNVAVDWYLRNEDGRPRKYNALFVAENRSFITPGKCPYPFGIKALMPNYRQFDDSRHFFDVRKLAYERRLDPADLIKPFETSKAKLGCVLCEDAWDNDYALSPLNILAQSSNVDMFINISASPFTFNKNDKRWRVFSAHARRLQRPFVYLNKTGIQNNGKTLFTFDGASCAYDGRGNAEYCGGPFEESTLTIDIPLNSSRGFATRGTPPQDGIADIYAALKFGISKFLEQCGIKKVVIGVSGGIDSAVVAALHAAILEPQNLLLVNMPGKYNSDTTKSLAKTLAQNAGCYYTDISIEESFATTMHQIDGLEISNADGSLKQKLQLSGFMQENIQARDRSSRILAALASAFGGAFTCNANKAEITIGYTTLYGDLGGYLAPIADLWKGEVYQLARYLNDEVFKREFIPQGTIDIVPSAELSSAQDVDQGKGDPLHYPYHDLLFRAWVEWWNRVTPEEILCWYSQSILEEKIGYEGKLCDIFASAKEFIADLERWWNLYQGLGVAKRIQAPPILAVKRRAFGFDHREAQMRPFYTDTYRRLKKKLLEPEATES